MIKLALIGLGTVGQGFIELLHTNSQKLKEATGFDFQLTAISDLQRGAVLDPAGLDLAMLLACLRESGTIHAYPGGIKGLDSVTTIRRSPAHVILEATPTNLDTAEPGLTHLRTAMNAGKHVVTCNKGPIARAWPELQNLAQQNHVRLRFEGTVMSGTPVINLVETTLRGCTILRVQGILNGTTNFILTRLEAGMAYHAALKQAQTAGYAETNPAADVEGWDTLAKIWILSRVFFNGQLEREAIPCTGIRDFPLERIQTARGSDQRWKLLGEIWRTGAGIQARVQPVALPCSHPLAQIDGVMNGIIIETDHLGAITVIGPGAGKRETAYALLSDLLQIAPEIK